jgi:hypothetical protein
MNPVEPPTHPPAAPNWLLMQWYSSAPTPDGRLWEHSIYVAGRAIAWAWNKRGNEAQRAADKAYHEACDLVEAAGCRALAATMREKRWPRILTPQERAVEIIKAAKVKGSMEEKDFDFVCEVLENALRG